MHGGCEERRIAYNVLSGNNMVADQLGDLAYMRT
jgi:hypothetical protein